MTIDLSKIKMTVIPLFADHLSPAELRAQQDEVIVQARRWLNPTQLAALLLNRSRDDLAPALTELLLAAHDLIDCLIEDEEASAEDRPLLTFRNVQKALGALTDHFGIETVFETIVERKIERDNEFGSPDDDDDAI